jgi:hypothetical protein
MPGDEQVDLSSALTEIGEAFTLLRNALGLAKEAKDMLPKPQQDAVAKTLEEADRASRIAEAQMAKAFGYKLHQCQFPPVIMLAVKMPWGEEQRCPTCGYTTEFHKPLYPGPVFVNRTGG